ncbi:multidrug resistance protein, MATE family [Cribrihabitans marinus]|uniref:Multidrug resistance protein, MATE family n=1 Tax=Cribrihabitans marinus TaxID=1227549 RepID=A0A1H7AXT0_9RHOB|nr:MATE family efflux transporter [Cribrihabitans marinus]GGH32706.1 MATE family efflux transporter [Cribrihabitans marinus]SEJ70068.1 multidrug resistance protein, MATE family [Cribrihabitans marinus]
MTSPGGEITHRRVLNIALPIVLSNATVPILGAVDTGVVGQLGEAAPIGAVGIGAVILATVYWVFSFLRMGTTGLAAQARGAGDTRETGALLMRGLILAGVAGGLLIAAQVVLFWGAFALAPASEEVETLALAYLEIRIWGAPATIALFAVTGWLIAIERTRGVFVLQLWMNGLNILLDLWFVLGLGWGVEGVAIATLCAEWSGLALGLWLCRSAFGGDQWRDWARVFDPVRIRRMVQVNADIMIRSVLLTLSFTTFLFIGADLGDVTLAANQVLVQFLEITAFALDGFAFSAEALVGGAVGAGRRSYLRRAAIVASQWGLGGALVLGALFYAAGPWLIDLMAKAPEVQAAARLYLPWLAIAPLLGVASWMLDGIFIGATWTRDMRQAMILSVAVYVAALAVLVPFYGNHGLWAALMVLNVTRGLTLWLRYPRLEAGVGP